MSLVVKDLVSGYYPEVDIIRRVSLHAEKGKITCIIGPNGCGKSTLLKTVYGLLKPKKGKVFYNNDEITGLKPHILVSKGISYIPQERCIFPDLTVHQNLKIATWIFRKDKKRVEESFKTVYEIFPVLHTKRKNKASTLSGGQQKMLEFSRGLILHSDLMLIDEPTAGLAPKFAKEVYQAMSILEEEGITMLLVDQNVRQAIMLSDYVYELSFGQLNSEGPKEKFESKLTSLVRDWI